MRFNFDAYAKVYPETAPAVSVESAVDTFKPTESEAKATEDKPGDDVLASIPIPGEGMNPITGEPETKPQYTAPEEVPEGGTNE